MKNIVKHFDIILENAPPSYNIILVNNKSNINFHKRTMAEPYKNPTPTVDIIIEINAGADSGGDKKIVLVKRKNPPFGWAIPGGFVDYGETLESAAVREAMEETSLSVTLVRQFHTYSDPSRDPRKHTISTVFIARAEGRPVAADDALEVRAFTMDDLPEPLAFDHADILHDYRDNKY